MTDHHDPRSAPTNHLGYRLNRERLLRGAAGAMLGMSPLLAAACGGGSSSSSPSSGSAGTPVKGGRLRAGFVGGGTAETLNPLIGITPIDQARIQNLYDPLVLVNADLSTSPGLRAGVEPQQATRPSRRSSCARASPSTTASRSAPTT